MVKSLAYFNTITNITEVQLNSSINKDCYVICKLGFENEKPIHMTLKGSLTLIDYMKSTEGMTFMPI